MLAPELQTKLAGVRDLPSPPKLAQELIEIAEQPDVSLGAVSAIIEKDPALSARLLKVANSSLYTRQRKRETVRQAILALGLNGTMTLALTFSLVGSIGRNGAETTGVDYQRFWRRSLMAGNAARALAEAACLTCLEQVFLAAILQDIGILVVDIAMPEFYQQAPDVLMDHPGLVVFERGELGATHAEVGAWLLDRWRLAEPLCEAVGTSHGAGAIPADYEFAGLARCVALSGDFADIWFMEEPHEAMRNLAEAAEHLLDIGPGELLDIFVQLRERLAETEAVFEMDILGDEEAERITAKAGELLSMQNFESAQDAGRARVHGLSDLKARLEREFPVARRGQWPLSVVALGVADAAPAGPAMVECVRELLPDTAALSCLDDARVLIMFSGVDAAESEAAVRELFDPLARPTAAGGCGLARERLRAGIATVQGAESYSSADNLVRAATAALHSAVREAGDAVTHHAGADGDVVDVGAASIDDFMAAQAR